jgi:hypothetical protein
MRNYMAKVAMHARAEEPSGESYGEERSDEVTQRVAELRGDVVAPGDSIDQQ